MQDPKAKIQNLKSTGPRGLTLIELLVAMMILLMITALTLPVIAPNLASRRVREAARAVDVYLGVARNRAMELGRPVGVMLAPLQLANAAGSTATLPATTTLFQVEVPPPYCGEQTISVATVTPVAAAVAGATPTSWTANMNNAANFNGAMVNVNDRMRLNHEGPLYQVTYVKTGPTGTTITLQLSAQTSLLGYQPPWTTTPTAVPYEIFPQPIRSSVPPLQLPAGAIVDLQYSGIDIPANTTSTTMNNWPYWFATMYTAANPTVYPMGVMIVFLPTGAVEGMYYPTEGQGATAGTAYPFRPTSLIYLNIGKFERMDRTVGPKPNLAPGGGTFAAKNPYANDGLYNWQDPDCLWVTINPQNGYVSTKENATLQSVFLNNSNAWYNQTTIIMTGTSYSNVNGANASRWIARQAQQMSGK